MRFLSFYPRRRASGQLHQLLLIAEKHLHRPAAALRPPRPRRRTARIIRDQVQVRPLRLVHADACQTNMAQVRTVDAGASNIVANAVRQPVMQLPAQGVHPVPLPRTTTS